MKCVYAISLPQHSSSFSPQYNGHSLPWPPTCFLVYPKSSFNGHQLRPCIVLRSMRRVCIISAHHSYHIYVCNGLNNHCIGLLPSTNVSSFLSSLPLCPQYTRWTIVVTEQSKWEHVTQFIGRWTQRYEVKFPLLVMCRSVGQTLTIPCFFLLCFSLPSFRDARKSLVRSVKRVHTVSLSYCPVQI